MANFRSTSGPRTAAFPIRRTFCHPRDHLKPHQVVDVPDLDTRALVISFLPECVFTPGGPPTDYVFLIPFHRKVEGRPRILRAGAGQAGDAHEALARLLHCCFDKGNPHREAGCKAWLLVLLNVLIQEFRSSALERVELLQRQKQSDQLKPLFDHVHVHYATRVSLETAARMYGLSKAQFGRTFKQASGMTLGRNSVTTSMRSSLNVWLV